MIQQARMQAVMLQALDCGVSISSRQEPVPMARTSTTPLFLSIGDIVETLASLNFAEMPPSRGVATICPGEVGGA